ELTYHSGGALPAVQHHPFESGGRGAFADTYRDLGNHPECALAADRQFPQVRSGSAAWSDPESPLATRRRQPDTSHHVVESAITRRLLSGGPRGGEATDRGAFEGLWHMSQGETVCGQHALRLRATHPGTEHRDAGDGIDRDQLVVSCEIQCDHRGLAATERCHSPHHRCTATEGHDGDVVPSADLQHPLHRLRSTR